MEKLIKIFLDYLDTKEVNLTLEELAEIKDDVKLLSKFTKDFEARVESEIEEAKMGKFPVYENGKAYYKVSPKLTIETTTRYDPSNTLRKLVDELSLKGNPAKFILECGGEINTTSLSKGNLDKIVLTLDKIEIRDKVESYKEVNRLIVTSPSNTKEPQLVGGK